MLPTQIQINATPSSPRAQQVMPTNHIQRNSINSMPNFPQIHPQLGSTIDPRIANSSSFTPLPPFMHAPNHPFPFQNYVPQLNPIGPVTHPGQFPFEFYPQNLNSVATNSNSFGVNSMSWGPNINQIHSFRNGQNVWRGPMPMNQSIPVQTPNYTHFVPGNWSMDPQIATFIPAQQFGVAPIYPPAQQAQNFQPPLIDPPQPKQVKNRQKWNSAGSGAGVDKQKNKTKSKNSKRRKKQKQEKESKAPTAGVDAADLEKKHIDSTKDEEKLIFLENESAQTKDNLVLRQLLRGPRYFDSSESWVVGEEVCQKCGNKDHKTYHCNVYKRKKPCFICGRFDHSGKLWKKAKGGFNCNISHLVKDCLERDPKANENYRICLKCGDSGHSMFSCNNDYSPDDLKQMKCYICNDFGHLCCAEYKDEGPKQSSCYKCGELGHLGHGCPKREGRSGGLKTANNLCASCGEKGHIAVDCRKNAKEDECIGELATVETSSFKEKEEDQAGTEVYKSLLKQNDATQGSSSSSGASLLVQV